jgi:hypothetical protein
MEEIFIITTKAVGLADIADVLRRTWKVDDELGVPYIKVDSHSTAYVAEQEVDELLTEDLFLEHPEMPEILGKQFGREYKIFSLRYRDPALAREMARAIASAELANSPMLLNADGTYLPAKGFLARLSENPPWDWYGQIDEYASTE